MPTKNVHFNKLILGKINELKTYLRQYCTALESEQVLIFLHKIAVNASDIPYKHIKMQYNACIIIHFDNIIIKN